MEETRLPQGWDEVYIGQYADLSLIQASVPDIIDRTLQRLSVLTGQSPEFFEKMKLEDLMKLVRKTAFLDTIAELESDSIEPTVNVDGQVFEVCLQAQKLSAGQLMTIKHFMRDIEGDETERTQRVFEVLHHLLAVVCMPCKRRRILGIPLGWKRGEYDGERHAEIAELFKHRMSMAQAYPIVVFFWKVSRSWMDSILDYGERKMKEMETMMEKELERITASN